MDVSEPFGPIISGRFAEPGIQPHRGEKISHGPRLRIARLPHAACGAGIAFDPG
ncbi:hypothetical protein [Methylobacterium sp. B1]|uniref:hypothetical protein n=1 Tax=Methylobacterium sp. B1 TaxID=91459 RepID=UPI0003466D70|nr:hypothetical protein [Methylobacterium sp. B1]